MTFFFFYCKQGKLSLLWFLWVTSTHKWLTIHLFREHMALGIFWIRNITPTPPKKISNWYESKFFQAKIINGYKFEEWGEIYIGSKYIPTRYLLISQGYIATRQWRKQADTTFTKDESWHHQWFGQTHTIELSDRIHRKGTSPLLWNLWQKYTIWI